VDDVFSDVFIKLSCPCMNIYMDHQICDWLWNYVFIVFILG
jgi:hypothetical protein